MAQELLVALVGMLTAAILAWGGVRVYAIRRNNSGKGNPNGIEKRLDKLITVVERQNELLTQLVHEVQVGNRRVEDVWDRLTRGP